MRIGLMILSMVACEMRSKAPRISGESAPKSCSYPDSQIGTMALSRFEQGRFAISQISFKGLMIVSF
jgi:hypothetical protein